VAGRALLGAKGKSRPLTSASRSRGSELTGLWSESEVGECAIAVEVRDQARELPLADVQQRRSFAPDRFRLNPLRLARPVPVKRTRRRSPSSSRISSAFIPTCSPTLKTSRRPRAASASPIERPGADPSTITNSSCGSVQATELTSPRSQAAKTDCTSSTFGDATAAVSRGSARGGLRSEGLHVGRSHDRSTARACAVLVSIKAGAAADAA
jgi:hypothetical protein